MRSPLIPMLRMLVPASIVCALILVGPAATRAQDPQLPRAESKVVETSDGLPLHFTYWPTGHDHAMDSGVVVLLHMHNGNRLDWTSPAAAGFVQRLQRDYAVIAVDLRGHGQSKGAAASSGGDIIDANTRKSKKSSSNGGARIDSSNLKPRDYEAMAFVDLEAIKRFIYEENQLQHLNMNKMAIIGAEMGANAAAVFAANDWLKDPHPDGQDGFRTPRGQDVRALVLLSPEISRPGLPIAEPLKVLKTPDFKVAVLVCVGEKDKEDKGEGKKVFRQLSSERNKDRMYLKEYDSSARGTDLMDVNGLKANIYAFLELHLKKVPSDWNDRQSKLGRKKSS